MRLSTAFFVALVLLFDVTARAGEEERKACPYPTDHEAALDATAGAVEEEEGFRRCRVEFNGIAGDRVPAFLYVPTLGAAHYPAVLLQYGSGGNKNVNYIVALARQFVASGYIVLTIDSPGKGDRKGEGAEVTDWITSDKGRDHFLRYCGDYSRAVDYLVARKDVDAERLAMVGISWGAITGITFAAHDPRIKAVCSILGGGGFLDLADSVRGARKPSIDPVKNVGLIAPRPLLLVNARKDQVILPPFSQALHRAAGKGAKKVWLDTDHTFQGVDHAAVGDRMIRFLTESLAEEPL